MADPLQSATLERQPAQTRMNRRAADAGFKRGLAGALLLHGLFLIGLWEQKPRIIGDPAGTDDPITVDIMTVGEMDAARQPAAAPAAPPPPRPQVPLKEAVADSVPQPAEKPPVPPPEKQAAAPALANLAEDPDLFSLQNPKEAQKPVDSAPSKVPAEQKPQPKNAQQNNKPVRTTKLDLSMPEKMTSEGGASSGFSASSTRPPNITRSSQNDAFGRAVIAALRVTMPPADGPPNRVTIRILLNEQGNATEVAVVRPSADAAFDQSVRFSALQANFPIPPGGSTSVDRTFVVTYIYH